MIEALKKVVDALQNVLHNPASLLLKTQRRNEAKLLSETLFNNLQPISVDA
ncbi:hypothetical protein AB4851_21555 [Burkholderia sp. 22PA0099]|uniref:hypothetical protein n=1 Tax=Burkholderia sp. 22PA0099 TaxID=3237372 RepID=UPI0039C15E36